jgi:peptidyl-prolyl cis-trans isomerase D
MGAGHGLFDFSRKVSRNVSHVGDLFNEVTVDAKEVEEYYNSHREAFRQPERVKFSYVAYPAKQFEAKVEVSAKDIEDFYNEHKEDRFTTPPRVQARHILFSVPATATDEEKNKVRTAATDVLTKARAGEDFAKLAETYSQDKASASKGGDLGSRQRGRMVKPFEALCLANGGISDLVVVFGILTKVEANEKNETTC